MLLHQFVFIKRFCLSSFVIGSIFTSTFNPLYPGVAFHTGSITASCGWISLGLAFPRLLHDDCCRLEVCHSLLLALF